MIQSMTAFATHSFEGDWGSAVWELRSVNHRFLDTNLRLPESLRELDLRIRECVRQHIQRGKIDCNLRYLPNAENIELSLNLPLVHQLAKTHQEISKIFGEAAPIDTMKLLDWSDILQTSAQDLTPIHDTLLSALNTALEKLVDVRGREGTALDHLLRERLHNMSLQVARIKKVIPAILEAQRDKLKKRLQEVQEYMDDIRLEQEMVFFAQRIDVTEELDRLATHITEVDRVLTEGGVVGKRLDFLMQELNREANTIASKSVTDETTHAAVELKVYIEQMREQVQNIV